MGVGIGCHAEATLTDLFADPGPRHIVSRFRPFAAKAPISSCTSIGVIKSTGRDPSNGSIARTAERRIRAHRDVSCGLGLEGPKSSVEIMEVPSEVWKTGVNEATSGFSLENSLKLGAECRVVVETHRGA